MKARPSPDGKLLARRRPISLPPALSDKADQRQAELGYSKFSQYVAYLIAKDSDRPDLAPAPSSGKALPDTAVVVRPAIPDQPPSGASPGDDR